jgi:hypothetical protein
MFQSEHIVNVFQPEHLCYVFRLERWELSELPPEQILAETELTYHFGGYGSGLADVASPLLGSEWACLLHCLLLWFWRTD